MALFPEREPALRSPLPMALVQDSGSVPVDRLHESNDLPLSQLVVDINTANCEELCAVLRCMTEQLACAVIHHRSENGKFKSTEQLLQVPGMSPLILEAISPRITLDLVAGLSTKATNVDREGKPLNRSMININTANYHELSVLSAITRQIANKIVKCRIQTANCRFTSMDELLHIPGMNGSILNAIRGRVTLGYETPLEHSITKFKVESRTAKKNRLSIDINSANYHELCTLPGITQQTAQNIVAYRIKHCKGHFTSTQQLLDVANMNFALLNGISSRITLGHECELPVSTLQVPEQKTNLKRTNNSTTTCARKPTKPLVQRSCILRIASWNLKCFNSEKAHNAGVMEVICSTILQHGLDLIAFQELADQTVLKLICDELNQPCLPKLKSWPTELKHCWKCISSEKTGRMYQGMEYNGFLWNEKRGLHLHYVALKGGKLSFVRKPFTGIFQFDTWKFAVVCVHLKAEGWNKQHAEQVNNEIRLLPLLMHYIQEEYTSDFQDVILLGDFNMSPYAESFSGLISSGYTPLLDATVPTNISPNIPDGNRNYDNIWVNASLQTEHYNGQCNVIRRGLQHALIAGQKPGVCGTVSDHCPIWAGFQCS